MQRHFDKLSFAARLTDTGGDAGSHRVTLPREKCQEKKGLHKAVLFESELRTDPDRRALPL